MSEYRCPHCGKPANDQEALLCLYCGENLERGGGVLGGMRYKAPALVLGMVIILILGLVLLFVLML